MRAFVGVAMQINANASVPYWPDVFKDAAAFVLADRTSPAQAIPIHLALKKLGGSMSPQPVDVMLWGVFKSTLLAVHDHLEASEAKPAAPQPGGGFPGDRAFQPQPGAFDASGFKPRV